MSRSGRLVIDYGPLSLQRSSAASPPCPRCPASSTSTSTTKTFLLAASQAVQTVQTVQAPHGIYSPHLLCPSTMLFSTTSSYYL